MREAMKDSGDEWKEKFSDMPRSVLEVPGGSLGVFLSVSDWLVDVMRTVSFVYFANVEVGGVTDASC